MSSTVEGLTPWLVNCHENLTDTDYAPLPHSTLDIGLRHEVSTEGPADIRLPPLLILAEDEDGVAGQKPISSSLKRGGVTGRR